MPPPPRQWNWHRRFPVTSISTATRTSWSWIHWRTTKTRSGNGQHQHHCSQWRYRERGKPHGRAVRSRRDRRSPVDLRKRQRRGNVGTSRWDYHKLPNHLTPYSAYSGPGYDNATFTATPNIGLNNTTITVSGESFDFLTTCFRAGTRIDTERGEVPVERLKIGDRVLTHFEASRPVVWIGQRTIDCRAAP